MMEENDDDNSSVDDVEQVNISASVFEAYSKQKEADGQRRKGMATAASLDHLGESPPKKEVKKVKENFGLKMKKYFASKLSETTTGQGIIQSYISERGQIVIKALCLVMVKFSGREIARVMRQYVYKLASKFGILYTEKLIGEDKLNNAREPVLVLAYHLMNHLNKSHEERQDPSDIIGLKSLITDAYEALQPLCGDLTGQTNTERLRVVYEYLTKGEFLNFFLCSPAAEDERKTICSALELEVEDTQGDAEITNRICRQRQFRRKNVLSALLGAPTLHLFLRNLETSKIVVRWIADKGGEDVIRSLSFALQVDDYTKQTTRASVAAQGLAIFDKYFANTMSDSLPVPSVIVEEIASKVHAEVFPMNLFWDAYTAVLKSLEVLFMEFLGSQEFSVLQLELRKLEKKLHVLAQLSGISDESFMVMMAHEKGPSPRKQSIHNDDLLCFDKSGTPQRSPGIFIDRMPLEAFPLTPVRKCSSSTSSGTTDLAERTINLKITSSSSIDEEVYIACDCEQN